MSPLGPLVAAVAGPPGPTARRDRALTWALSLAGHLSVLVVLLSARAAPPKAPEPGPMSVTVTLVEAPRPADPVAPIAPPQPSPATAQAQPSPAKATARPAKTAAAATPAAPAAPTPAAPSKPSKRPSLARAAPAPSDADAGGADDGPAGPPAAELGEGELAAAATAGSGPPGRACNMPRLLQDALRKDPLVRAAIAEAHLEKATLVWNGDWVRHPGQEGAGLAAVREALMWEIGFAPEACRKEPVRGLVLLSMNDGPAPARLVVGSGVWRWSDLLFAGRAAPGGGGATR